LKQVYKKIIEYIIKYDTIIIHRHYYPDGDAYGSQIGLRNAIRDTFVNKNVYVVGDSSHSNLGIVMDEIDDSVFNNALSIILDVSDSHRTSDQRYELSSDVIIIDHHENVPTIKNSLFVHFPKYVATAEIIIEFIQQAKLVVSPETSTFLYYGILTDTGRFLYLEGNTELLFKHVSFICKYQPNIKLIHDSLYTEKLKDKLEKLKFSNFELTENNVAYRFNTKEIMDNSIFDFNKVNRGMINQMSGIKGIDIWASFTYNSELNKIFCEFRSRDIIIVDVAKKFGGGGHNYACGCSILDFNQAYEILRELDKKVRINNGKENS
jgi:phosphoesterase RecJ-like protein